MLMMMLMLPLVRWFVVWVVLVWLTVGRLEEVSLLDHSLHGTTVAEDVLHPIRLALTRRARCVAAREPKMAGGAAEEKVWSGARVVCLSRTTAAVSAACRRRWRRADAVAVAVACRVCACSAVVGGSGGGRCVVDNGG